MSIENNNKIEEAKNFAIQVHTGHKRKSGEDYYVHTFRVYEKLKEIGYNIPKEQINLKDPIKEIGEREVNIILPHSLEANIKVIVVAEEKKK